VSTATKPLQLPSEFDPEACRTAEQGVFHESPGGARLAALLVAHGAPRDLELAVRCLESTLACQERNRDDQHHGNFAWMREDRVVTDVNAVEFCLQSNVLIAHYRRPGSERPGVLYSRHLVNDKWIGDFYHPTDRSHSPDLLEEGRFMGVQDGARALCLYGANDLGVIHSAKACLAWTRADAVDGIWLDGRRLEVLPAEIPEGSWIVIAGGDVLFALCPLSRTDLGCRAPIRLSRIQGDLVLEMYNCLGPDRSYWQVGSSGAFFRGYPHSGVYLEMASAATTRSPRYSKTS
jgi:hypothetical protein